MTSNLVSNFANEIKPFQTEWRKRQDKFIKAKFEDGYSTGDIAREMNNFAQRELGAYFRTPISSWGINGRVRDIYNNWGFSDTLNPTEIQKIILKEKLTSLYNDGYTTYDTLLPHFPAFSTRARFRDFIGRNYGGIKNLFRDSLELISTDSFRMTVELIRNYEENNIDYSHTSLWSDIFSTRQPTFYKRFGLYLSEIKLFALTGVLPHRFRGINFRL